MVLFPGADISLQLPTLPKFNSGKEVNNRVSLKWSENLVESDKSLKHELGFI